MSRFCNNRGTHKGFRGFLLFEAMIAVTVLAVGITLTLRSFNSIIMAIKGLQDYSIAMFLLEQKMSQLQTGEIQQVDADGQFQDEFRKFSWKVNSAQAEGLPLDKIDISIMWDTANSTRSFSAATYLKHKEPAQ